MYSTGSPDEWDLLWELPDETHIVSLAVTQKSADRFQASFSSKALHGPADGLGNGRHGQSSASATRGPGLADPPHVKPAGAGCASGLTGSWADPPPAEGAPVAPQALTSDMDPPDHFSAFPLFPAGAPPTSSTNSLPPFMLPPFSVDSSPEHPALFPGSDTSTAAEEAVAADLAGGIPPPRSHALFYEARPRGDDFRSRSASNSTGGAAAESTGPCTSGSVPAAPAPDPECGRGEDATSPRFFDPDRIAAALDAAENGAPIAGGGGYGYGAAVVAATEGTEGAVMEADRCCHDWEQQQAAEAACEAPAAGEASCDMLAAAAPPPPRPPSDPAEVPWSLESLRRRCSARDPRVAFLRDLRSQRSREEEGPPAGVTEAVPAVRCEVPSEGIWVDRDPHHLGDHGLRSSAAAAAVVSGPAWQSLRPPVSAAPLPRRAKTTTARLLSRLRPTGAAAAAAALDASRTAGGAGDVCSPPRAPRHRDVSLLLAEEANGVSGGDDGMPDGDGGAGAEGKGVWKRRHSVDGAPARRVRGAWIPPTDPVAVSGGEHGAVRRAAPSAALLEEVQRALESAELDDGGARAAAAQKAKSGWRLPPPRRRFDFLVDRRRRVAGLDGTATLAGAPPPPVSSPRAASGVAMGGSQRIRRQSGFAFRAVDARGGLEVDALADDPWDAPGEGDVTADSDEASGGDSNRQQRGGNSCGVKVAGGGGGSSGGGSPALSLLQALDAWRTQRARSLRKSPDALLRMGLLGDLAARCPTSVLDLEELIKLPRPFIRKYGQEVLEICRNHVHVQEIRTAARSRSAAAAAPTRGSCGGAAAAAEPPPPPPPRRPEYPEGSREAAWEAAFAAAVGVRFLPSHGSDERRGGVGGVRSEAATLDQGAPGADGGGAERQHQAGAGVAGSDSSATADIGGCDLGSRNDGDSGATHELPAKAAERDPGPNAPSSYEATKPAEAPAVETGSGAGSGSGAGLGTAQAAPRRGLTKASAARHCRSSDAQAQSDAAADAAAAAAPGADAVAGGTTRAKGAGKRPASGREDPGAGPTHRSRKRHKRHHGSAASARPKKARAGLDLAAAAAAAARDPSGWVPLPAGCRARVGSHLAYASAPPFHGARVSSLLGFLAEAGPAAAATAATTGAGGDATASPPLSPAAPDAAGDEAAAAAAQPRPRAAAAAMVPAAAVTIAAAAKGSARPAGLEHLRRLREMAEAALPAWEVRRVLACRALGAAAQAAAVLRLEQGASRDAVRVAFRRLSLLVHPDKNRTPGAAEAFALVSAAASSMLGSSAA